MRSATGDRKSRRVVCVENRVQSFHSREDPDIDRLQGQTLDWSTRISGIRGEKPFERPLEDVLQRTLIVLSLLVCGVFPQSIPAQEQYPPETDLLTTVGSLSLNVTNLGYIGHAWSKEHFPSCQYPQQSNVEHIYRGGLWVGARNANGEVLVSTGAQDANGLEEGDSMREFVNDVWTDVDTLSTNQNSRHYSPDALATQQFNCYFEDYFDPEGGNHTPLGLSVMMRTLAWGNPYADDFVILDYTIKNISGTELRDVYLGFWCDTTVGNTEITDPWDNSGNSRWIYVDDMNGAWGPVADENGESYGLPADNTPADDPKIWMTYEHDDDGEDGLATSWVGVRLLGTDRVAQPEPGVRPVSYNAWRFRQVPDEDDTYYDPTDPDKPLDGKYQIMSNGEFDVGMSQEANFDVANNWVSLISTGPFPYWAPDETMTFSVAVTCGVDSLALLENSKVAQVAYDSGFDLPTGPPSPILDIAYEDNSVILRWEPGTDEDPDTGDPLPAESPLRVPEYHINKTSARLDFQGYRVFRYEGENFTGVATEQAVLVAEFDIVDGRGFDTGLPELTLDGLREFQDSNLREGHAYWYSVVSFSLPDEVTGQPAFESGFFENGKKIYPGPSPASDSNPRGVGVYPNPYRVTSVFESGFGQIETGRRLWFTGLPESCRIQVFNLVGELVKTLHHDDPVDGKEPWDILSEPDRAIASGLYIYVVEDLATGKIQRGKLVIIK